MTRVATTTDVFNAIAEPRQREVIGALRKVGVVSVIRRGQHRMSRLNAAELKPVQDWVKTYERYWTRQLSQTKERAERKALERMVSIGPGEE